MIKPKIFISYNREDTEFRKQCEKIIKDKGIEYYAVPVNQSFEGQHNQEIMKFLQSKLATCNIILCLVGKNTYSRAYVDNEIHTALKGGVQDRCGLIIVNLPTRRDEFHSLRKKTYPPRLLKNLDYAIKIKFVELDYIEQYTNDALLNARNSTIEVDNSSPCMRLKNKKYFDN